MITPPRSTNLQLYLQEAIWNKGHATDWREFLVGLRRRPLSLTQIGCEIYAQLGLRVDPTTLSRWLKEAEAWAAERPK